MSAPAEGLLAPRRARAIDLAATPPLLPEVFERLAASGAQASCLFGGAARDADLEALWGEPRQIKDYDMRVWLGPREMEGVDWEARFGQRLLSAFEGSALSMEASAGTGRLRHCLAWRGLELDISARPLPWPGAGSADCARERALDSDASLSAVAIDSSMSAWCEELYAVDRKIRRLTIYPGSDPARLAAYGARMRAKFPGMAVCGPGEELGAPAPRAAGRRP